MDAKNNGGIVFMSVEVFVMKMEQRDYVIQVVLSNNQKWEDYLSTAKSFKISKHSVVEAYKRIKENAGSAGIDKESIQDFENNLKDNLYRIWNRLSSGSYFPPAVKGVPIPKKSGGVRVLGIPTVSDRIAQMVIKMELEPILEPYFHCDSYGYRPNKSAHQAIEITRRRCWEYDWVLEFDIKGLFDNINHELLMKALKKHTDNKWILLYVQRWLTAPLQTEEGKLIERNKGVPQGGVVSPILSNLFLHYVFDKWMERNFPEMKWCRYADDGLVHCKTYKDAQEVKAKLEQRFNECKLELHPIKTKIIYCKDGRRRRNYKETKFDFLGFTFAARGAIIKSKGKLFTGFLPAASKSAMNSMRKTIRKWKVPHYVSRSILELAEMLNPVIRGWINYYGRFYPSALMPVYKYINARLRTWVGRKYIKLRWHKTLCTQWLGRVAKQNPKLFAHWSSGEIFAFE